MSTRQRRHWSDDDKRQIVIAAQAPGVSVSEVARSHGVNANLLFKWLKEPRLAEASDDKGFIPVEVRARGEEPPVIDQEVPTVPRASLPRPPKLEERPGIIEIDLACGTRVRVDAHLNDRALARVLRILRAAG